MFLKYIYTFFLWNFLLLVSIFVVSCGESTNGQDGLLLEFARTQAGITVTDIDIDVIEGDDFVFDLQVLSYYENDLGVYFCYDDNRFQLQIDNTILPLTSRVPEEVSCNLSSFIDSTNVHVYGPFLITQSNWLRSHTVVVSAFVDDAISTAYIETAISLGIQTEDPIYKNFDFSDYSISVRIQDSSIQDIVVNAISSYKLREGEIPATQDVLLSEDPLEDNILLYLCLDTTNVFVEFGRGDIFEILPEATSGTVDTCSVDLLGPLNLDSTNWSVGYQLKYTAIDDLIVEESAFLVPVTYLPYTEAGLPFGREHSSDLIVLDNDKAGILLKRMSDNTTVDTDFVLSLVEEDIIELSIELLTQPQFENMESFKLVLDISSSNSRLTVTPNQITFDAVNNLWNIPQNLNISAEPDLLVDSSVFIDIDIGVSLDTNLLDPFYQFIQDKVQFFLSDDDKPSFNISTTNFVTTSAEYNFSYVVNSSTPLGLSAQETVDTRFYFCHSSGLSLKHNTTSLFTTTAPPLEIFCNIEYPTYSYLDVTSNSSAPLNITIDFTVIDFTDRFMCNSLLYIQHYVLSENSHYTGHLLDTITINQRVPPFDDVRQAGTVSSPYQISSLVELQRILCDLGAHYELVNDINASATVQWTIDDSDDSTRYPFAKLGFIPIGYDKLSSVTAFQGVPFSGSLDGNNSTVSNLYMEHNGDYVGLFGYLTDSAVVENLNIDSASIIACDNSAILAGYNSGYISNISVSNSTLSQFRGCSLNISSTLALLVATQYEGEIKNISITDSSILSPKQEVSTKIRTSIIGGVLGRNQFGGILEDITLERVTLEGDSTMGGVIGVNSTAVLNRASIVGLDIDSLLNRASIVGLNIDSLLEANSINHTVGGVVGVNIDGAIIENVNASSVDIDGTTLSRTVGGFAGENVGGATILSSAVEGTVQIAGQSIKNIGAFIGYDQGGIIKQSWSDMNITLNGRSQTIQSIGGFIGTSSETLVIESLSFVEIIFNVSVDDLNLTITDIGGFLGYGVNSFVSNSYVNGVMELFVDLIDDDSFYSITNVGMFAGSLLSSTLDRSYAMTLMGLDLQFSDNLAGIAGQSNVVDNLNSYWVSDILFSQEGDIGVRQSDRTLDVLKSCEPASSLSICSDTFQTDWNTSAWHFQINNVPVIVNNSLSQAEQYTKQNFFLNFIDDVANVDITCSEEDCGVINIDEILTLNILQDDTTSYGGSLYSWNFFVEENVLEVTPTDINFGSNTQVSFNSIYSLASITFLATVNFSSYFTFNKVLYSNLHPSLQFFFLDEDLKGRFLSLDYRSPDSSSGCRGNSRQAFLPMGWSFVPDNTSSIMIVQEDDSEGSRTLKGVYIFNEGTFFSLPSSLRLISGVNDYRTYIQNLGWEVLHDWSQPECISSDLYSLYTHFYAFSELIPRDTLIEAMTSLSISSVEELKASDLEASTFFQSYLIESQALELVVTDSYNYDINELSGALTTLINNNTPPPVSIGVENLDGVLSIAHVPTIQNLDGSIIQCSGGDNKAPELRLYSTAEINTKSYVKSVVVIIQDDNQLQSNGRPWVLLNLYRNRDDTSGFGSDGSSEGILDYEDSGWFPGNNSWAEYKGNLEPPVRRGWVGPCINQENEIHIISIQVYLLTEDIEEDIGINNMTSQEFEEQYESTIVPYGDMVKLISSPYTYNPDS